MSSRSYILQIMLWHQSLKSIHYRTLLIFLNKNNRFEGQNKGGIKDMISPPCQNMGRIYHPHPPQDLRPCLSCSYGVHIAFIWCSYRVPQQEILLSKKFLKTCYD